MEEQNVAPVPAPAVGATKATPPGKGRASTGPAVGPSPPEDCPLSAETPVIFAQWIHRAASGRHARSQEAWPRGARLHTHAADIHPRTCVRHTRILLCTSPELPDPSGTRTDCNQRQDKECPPAHRTPTESTASQCWHTLRGLGNGSAEMRAFYVKLLILRALCSLGQQSSVPVPSLPPHAPRVLKGKPL